MKKQIIFVALLSISILFSGCKAKDYDKTIESTTEKTSKESNESSLEQIEESKSDTSVTNEISESSESQNQESSETKFTDMSNTFIRDVLVNPGYELYIDDIRINKADKLTKIRKSASDSDIIIDKKYPEIIHMSDLDMHQVLIENAGPHKFKVVSPFGVFESEIDIKAVWHDDPIDLTLVFGKDYISEDTIKAAFELAEKSLNKMAELGHAGKKEELLNLFPEEVRDLLEELMFDPQMGYDKNFPDDCAYQKFEDLKYSTHENSRADIRATSEKRFLINFEMVRHHGSTDKIIDDISIY